MQVLPMFARDFDAGAHVVGDKPIVEDRDRRQVR